MMSSTQGDMKSYVAPSSSTGAAQAGGAETPDDASRPLVTSVFSASSQSSTQMRLSLCVLRCRDIEASKEVYTARFGLSFVKEKHGKVPEHYATELIDRSGHKTVLELYPLRSGLAEALVKAEGKKDVSLEKTILSTHAHLKFGIGESFSTEHIKQESTLEEGEVLMDPDQRSVSIGSFAGVGDMLGETNSDVRKEKVKSVAEVEKSVAIEPGKTFNRSITHLRIRCKDIEQSIKFYQLLGMRADTDQHHLFLLNGCTLLLSPRLDMEHNESVAKWSRMRLRFDVPDLGALKTALTSNSVDFVPMNYEGVEGITVRDPDLREIDVQEIL